MVWWLWHESVKTAEIKLIMWTYTIVENFLFFWEKKKTLIWQGHTELIESYSEDLFICYKKDNLI